MWRAGGRSTAPRARDTGGDRDVRDSSRPRVAPGGCSKDAEADLAGRAVVQDAQLGRDARLRVLGGNAVLEEHTRINHPTKYGAGAFLFPPTPPASGSTEPASCPACSRSLPGGGRYWYPRPEEVTAGIFILL